jgi:hypothetical protein
MVNNGLLNEMKGTHLKYYHIGEIAERSLDDKITHLKYNEDHCLKRIKKKKKKK